MKAVARIGTGLTPPGRTGAFPGIAGKPIEQDNDNR